MSFSRTLSTFQELQAFAVAVQVSANRNSKDKAIIDNLIPITDLHFEGLTTGLSPEKQTTVAELIALIVKKHPYLKKIFLSDNRFTEAQTDILAEAFSSIKADPQITHLDLSKCSLGSIPKLIVLVQAALSPRMQQVLLKGAIPPAELVDEKTSPFPPLKSSGPLEDSDFDGAVALKDPSEDDVVLCEYEEKEDCLTKSGAHLQATTSAYRLMELRLAHKTLVFDESTAQFLSRLERVYGSSESKAKAVGESQRRVSQSQSSVASTMPMFQYKHPGPGKKPKTVLPPLPRGKVITSPSG